MASFKALCLAGVASLAAIATANAADLPAPAHMPAPPVLAPVVVGAGWYIRGDVGVGIADLEQRRSTFDPGFDADAAGVAEAHWGAARNIDGLVVLTTLGTGIGGALIYKNTLVPNAELGHLELDGHDAESRASNKARETEELTYEQWAERLQRYYAHLEFIFSPDLPVVGGGVSKSADKFLPLLDLRTPIVPATLRNNAGIMGAAALAAGI